MEDVAQITIIVRHIQLAVRGERAIDRIGDIDRQRPVGRVLRLGVRAQARQEIVLDPDLAAVAEAVAVKGGLQGGVGEHAEAGVPGRVEVEEGVDGRDGFVQLLADARRDPAFENGGRGLGVVELDVGDDDDLSAVRLLGEGFVELAEAVIEGAARLQRRVHGGEVLGAAAPSAEVVDASPDDGVEMEVVAPGRQRV